MTTIHTRQIVNKNAHREKQHQVKKVLYIVSNIFSTTMHTRFLPQSFASRHYTPLSPFPYAALHCTSLHFTTLFTLLDDFHFTSFPFTTLLTVFPHTLFFFNLPQ
jgi:hypothetical protein